MAVTYPYVSSQGAVSKTLDQFRKSFPGTVDAEVLKKFGIAPGNESYIISILRFLGLIDADGKRVDAAVDFFFHDEQQFQAGLEAVVQHAYKPLFDDFGPDGWGKSRADLTTWFRVSDKSSDLIGGRQAQTFLTLAALAGHGEVKVPPTKAATKRSPGGKERVQKPGKTGASSTGSSVESAPPTPPQVKAEASDAGSGFGLTVRIEINLPAGGTPDVYDAIFASVRKHLIERG